MKYNHIFIDLDRTLYDFDKSTRETFLELFEKFNLKENGVHDFEAFLNLYNKNNIELWDQYRNGEITKKFLNVHRFHISLLHFGIDDRAFAGRFASDYLLISPLKKALFPEVNDILKYLKKKYSLHIITNGFEEVQRTKIKANNLDQFFKTVTTSEEAEAKKPKKEIFLYALKKAGAGPEESLMIGDDYEVDILGAKSVGMDQMLFSQNGTDPSWSCTYIIRNWPEIKAVL
ncbi:MAG: YjjG family noncanonical pyrimidine nucleotidase [Bacteroidales bacterium]|nr:YjjG family noncanonical pyrimidine nucleotidase [Bacteroidales bacterium]